VEQLGNFYWGLNLHKFTTFSQPHRMIGITVLHSVADVCQLARTSGQPATADSSAYTVRADPLGVLQRLLSKSSSVAAPLFVDDLMRTPGRSPPSPLHVGFVFVPDSRHSKIWPPINRLPNRFHGNIVSPQYSVIIVSHSSFFAWGQLAGVKVATCKTGRGPYLRG
jgi:hypothetical protein